MAFVYKSLPTWQNSTSGIADYVLLAPVSFFDVDGIKCPEAPFTNPGDEVKILTAHTFLSGKGFIRVALAPEKNQLNAKTIGDKGFQKLDFELDIFVPGSYADVHELIKNLINTPLIAIVKDSNCGADILYQLGCDCVYAYASFDFSTGTNNQGVKGYNGKITYQNGYIQQYAAGAPTEI